MQHKLMQLNTMNFMVVMIKCKNILNSIKTNLALTIIEVLVATILTSIVMLYGTTFFIATWRLSTESKEYSMILNDVASNLEKYTSRKFDTSTTISSTTYVVYSRTLRDKYDVKYSLIKDTAPYNKYGFCYVISDAKWRYGGDENSNIRISIKTAIAPKW